MPATATRSPQGQVSCAEAPRQACRVSGSAVYRRRRPERTLLYRTVQNHLATWLALHDDGTGGGVPGVTEREFRRYLECGILAHGFARARCADCGHDFLIAYSCKGRGVCPSLLSPHRRPQCTANLHGGTITTERPNALWGTDGIRIEALDEGWAWMFSAVDHCDAYCVGIHAVKIGNRFAALQLIAQGLLAEFGATGADAGRGLSLRMDNGTQYTAEDFLNQIKFWGVAPSFAFVAEPQTNGVAERFNRTLKEQTIHGRVFRNVEEVRAAVTAFKERYNPIRAGTPSRARRRSDNFPACRKRHNFDDTAQRSKLSQ